ncbi:MAG: alpha/beta fold hydrolase, partial [Myxococcales bacterium]|nr:alpha/beta fold hydrolase [Myxococcales bacterium]
MIASRLGLCCALLLIGCGAAPTRSAPPVIEVAGVPVVQNTPEEAPRGTVLLVSGLGTGPMVWDLPGYGGLGPALARQGLVTLALDLAGRDTIEAQVEAIAAVAAASAKPVHAIGLDLGGTALLKAVLAGAPFDSVVAIGAPVSSGGLNRSQRMLVAAPGAPTWRDASRRKLHGTSLARLLMTSGLPA